MFFRLIEIVLPEGYKKVCEEALKEKGVLVIWQETIEENRVHMKILVPTEQSETMWFLS